MRIAGEIVNSRSAAADLTQSRSTRSATRRLDTKAGDSYCSLSPARPFGVHRQALTCLKSCPKNGDVPKSSFLPIGSHGAYRQAHSQIIDLGFLTSGAIGIRIMPIRAPVARGVLAGEHRVRYRRCLRWGGQKRTNCDLAQGVTPKPGRAPVARPFPEPQGDRSSFLNGLRRGPC